MQVLCLYKRCDLLDICKANHQEYIKIRGAIKYNRQPEKFEIFNLFSTLAPGWDLQLNDEHFKMYAAPNGTI